MSLFKILRKIVFSAVVISVSLICVNNVYAGSALNTANAEILVGVDVTSATQGNRIKFANKYNELKTLLLKSDDRKLPKVF